MREPVGRPDHERVERVAAVEVHRVRIVRRGVRLGTAEVLRPALLGVDPGVAVVVDLVGVGRSRRNRSRGRRIGEAVGCVLGLVGGRRDANAQFHALAELAAERGDDGFPQVALDLVLHERRRNRQQGKPLGDHQGFDQLEPGPLLRSEHRKRRIALAISVDVPVELGDDAVPDGDERWVGVSSQGRLPPLRRWGRPMDDQKNDGDLSTYLSTACGERTAVVALLCVVRGCQLEFAPC